MDIREEMLGAYLYALVGRIYKILPLWESQQDTVTLYLQSLQLELIGLQNLPKPLESEPLILSVVATLQYFIDHPACDVRVVRREVFRCINSCDTLCRRYGGGQQK